MLWDPLLIWIQDLEPRLQRLQSFVLIPLGLHGCYASHFQFRFMLYVWKVLAGRRTPLLLQKQLQVLFGHACEPNRRQRCLDRDRRPFLDEADAAVARVILIS